MVKILIIKPSSLGDIIHAAGPVARLARAAPDAHLTWVANEQYAPFVRGLPGVDEVLPFPRDRFVSGRFPGFLPEAVSWTRKLRGFDVAVDLQGLHRSGAMVRLSGAGERFGPRDARELAWIHYTHRIEIPVQVRHAVARLDYLMDAVLSDSALLAVAGSPKVAAAGAPAGPPSSEPFRLPVPPRAREEAERLLADLGPLVALCPGTRWKSKRWPVSRWARLVAELDEQLPGVQIVILGPAGEGSLARAILSQAAAGDGDPWSSDLTGKGDLWTTAAVLERAACAVATDSAQLHLAAAVGTPTVSLFGPTDPRRFAPRGAAHRVLRREELSCLGCHRRTCPLERRVCLPDLEVDSVADAVSQVLKRSA
jgi:heptosyltransferase-1